MDPDVTRISGALERAIGSPGPHVAVVPQLVAGVLSRSICYECRALLIAGREAMYATEKVSSCDT